MKRLHRLHHPVRGAGFTLIEVMIGLVILALVLAIAVPSMQEFIARKRVEGVAQELATDLRLLKSQQIQRRQPVGVWITSNATVSCYSLYVIGAGDKNCNCTNGSGLACPNPGAVGSSFELKTVTLPQSAGITVTSSPDLLRLLGHNGMPEDNVSLRLTVSSPKGGSIRLTTNPLALPTMCSVKGVFNGVPACST